MYACCLSGTHRLSPSSLPCKTALILAPSLLGISHGLFHMTETTTAGRDRRRFFVVLNSTSGEGNADHAAAQICQVLSGADRLGSLLKVETSLTLASIAQQAALQASREDGILVAAGGDGTLNAVAAAAMKASVPLGIVPLGTFNYFARNHGIPLDTTLATAALLNAHTARVQVGSLNDRIFLVNASLGLYPKLLEERESNKRAFGRNRFVAFFSALLTLLRAHRTLGVQIDSGSHNLRIRTLALVVANDALQLEQLGVELEEALDKGRLVSIVIDPMGTLALYGLLIRGLTSRLGDASSVKCFTCRDMLVNPTGKRRVRVAMDGEVTWMQPPLRFAAIEDSLQLLIPRAEERHIRQ